MTCFGQWRQTKPFLVRKEAMREYRYRHFERKREIFFGCGKTVYACERKREAGYSKNVGYGVSCKRISRTGEEENCNKDPSATLGMTIREEG